MKTTRTLLLAATAACAALSVGAAHAATIVGLYNTGVSGGLLPDGSIDPHWQVEGGPAYVYTNGAYLLTPDARFISHQLGGGDAVSVHSYTLTFDLAGLNAATAELSGFFEADNYAQVFLNDIFIGQDIQDTVFPNFQSLTSFSASAADFVSGLNTLKFVVTDTGPPAALLVSGLRGSAAPAGVPEPASWALMIGGFGMAGAALRRRRSAAATA